MLQYRVLEHPKAMPSDCTREYQLFKLYDINGYDIDYVEYANEQSAKIIDVCHQNPQAIGFNYNGYIKGGGGKLQKIQERNFWLKNGIDPWICIKNSKLNLVMPEILP